MKVYDYETLHTDVRVCPVVSVAVIKVDSNKMTRTGYSFEELLSHTTTMKFDIQEQVEKYARRISRGTMEWWLGLPPEAQAILDPTDDDCSITELIPFLKDNMCTGRPEPIFSRGNTFDPMITKYVADQLNQPYPYQFWLDRDTRTYIDALIDVAKMLGKPLGGIEHNSFKPPESEGFIAHDAAHDVAMDVFRIQHMLKVIK